MLPRWAYGFWQSRQRYNTQAELLGVRRATTASAGSRSTTSSRTGSTGRKTSWGSHQFDKTRFPDPKGMLDKLHAHARALHDLGVAEVLSDHGELQGARRRGLHVPRQHRGRARGLGGAGLSSTRSTTPIRRMRATSTGARSTTSSERAGRRCLVDGCDRAGRALQPRHRRAQAAHWADRDGPGRGVLQLLSADAHRRRVRGPARRSTRTSACSSSPARGSPGMQRNAAAVWSGDIASRWDNLYNQISAGVNISMSGMPNWTFDIGGFALEDRYMRQARTPADLKEWRELNLRWFQFGAFAPLFRSHGEFPYREIFNLAPKRFGGLRQPGLVRQAALPPDALHLHAGRRHLSIATAPSCAASPWTFRVTRRRATSTTSTCSARHSWSRR